MRRVGAAGPVPAIVAAIVIVGLSPPIDAAAPTVTAPMAAGAAASPSPTPTPLPTPSAPAESGPVRIQADIDRRTVTLGDPITLTVRLAHPSDVKVGAFSPWSALGDLALLGPPESASEKLPDGRMQETRRLRIAAYRTGDAFVPSIEAAFADAAGRPGKVATPPIPFKVGSILAAGDERPADIKRPAGMPEVLLWPWLLAAVAALLVAGAWLWQRRRRRPAAATPAEPPAPPRPAHEIAYAELERLLSAGLLEKGRVKEFYIELAEILKRYFGARFRVDTFERTTAEILEALRLARVPVRGLSLSGEVLRACDLVKFAKYVPPPEETRATVEQAYRLVDDTRERPTTPSEPVVPAARVTAAGGTGA